MPKQTGRRSGFTLIELLVVISIIGVLIALLLPAVQAAREAARRSQCTNNMKQVGVAMHNYLDVHRRFPLGADEYPAHGGDCQRAGHTAWAFILPYMEQQAVFNAINFQVHARGVDNGVQAGRVNYTGLSVGISSYVCPSDTMQTPPAFPNDPYAQGSYALSAGTRDIHRYWFGCPGTGNPNIDPDGVFGRGYSYPESEIRDGLSNTVFVGEMGRYDDHPIGYQYTWSSYAHWSLPAGTKYHGATFPQTIALSISRPNAKVLVPDLPASGTNGLRELPDSVNMGQWGFRSAHSGGVNFLFGDGSVRFIKDSINIPVYRALSTRKGGEAISSDQL